MYIRYLFHVNTTEIILSDTLFLLHCTMDLPFWHEHMFKRNWNPK